MTEKEVPAVPEYEYSDEEFDSIDHEIAIEDTDDEYNDKPCISTCCCCCNLGLGSIMAGVIFMILNAIYIGRQMTSLNESMADGNTMDNIQFNDGHLDTIFAFVGIALASISGLTAFGLMTLSCCCGVAEHVSRVKIAAFSWTVATGLGSIWVLGEALYRTFQEEDDQMHQKGLGYIIINDINNVENPEEDRLKQLIITWIIAGCYILLYIYLAVVVMSFVHVLSRTSVLSQSEQLAKRQGIKNGSPDLSMHSEAALMQRAYSYGGFNNGAFGQQEQQQATKSLPTLSEQVMAQQNYPEMIQQQQQAAYHHEDMYQQQIQLPPMFQETIVAGPQGEPISVVIDTTSGQIVPPEIIQQIMMDSMYMQQQQQQQMVQMAQSECNSVITDCTYRSGAALLNNQPSMMSMPQPIQQQQPVHMQRQRSVRSVTFNEEPQTRYIEPIASPEPNSSSEDENPKGVRFSLYTEEVEVAPYPAEQKIQHIPPCSSESD